MGAIPQGVRRGIEPPERERHRGLGTAQEEIGEKRDGRADVHSAGVLHVRGIHARRLDSPREEEVEDLDGVRDLHLAVRIHIAAPEGPRIGRLEDDDLNGG